MTWEPDRISIFFILQTALTSTILHMSRHMNEYRKMWCFSKLVIYKTLCQQFRSYLEFLRMETENASTSSISSQLQNVNTVRRESGNVTTQPWEINNGKSEVSAFVVNTGMNVTANKVHIYIFKNKYGEWVWVKIVWWLCLNWPENLLLMKWYAGDNSDVTSQWRQRVSRTTVTSSHGHLLWLPFMSLHLLQSIVLPFSGQHILIVILLMSSINQICHRAAKRPCDEILLVDDTRVITRQYDTVCRLLFLFQLWPFLSSFVEEKCPW